MWDEVKEVADGFKYEIEDSTGDGRADGLKDDPWKERLMGNSSLDELFWTLFLQKKGSFQKF